MKDYILKKLEKIDKYKKDQNIKAILQNKNWHLFSKDYEKEELIFRHKEELLIIKKGIVKKSSWELLPTGSILITTDSTIYSFNIINVDNNIVVLQADGTTNNIFLIDEQKTAEFSLNTYEDVIDFFNKKGKEVKQEAKQEEAKQEEAKQEEVKPIERENALLNNNEIQEKASKQIRKWKDNYLIIAMCCAAIFYLFGGFHVPPLGNYHWFIISLFIRFILPLILWVSLEHPYIKHKIKKWIKKNPSDPINPYLEEYIK